MGDAKGPSGTSLMLAQASIGLALFTNSDDPEVSFNVNAAAAYKAEQDAVIKAKEENIMQLTGKDNMKRRNSISKEVSAIKTEVKYIDACKVLKGLLPPQGNFVIKSEAPQKAAPVPEGKTAESAEADLKTAAKKEDKKPKKTESAGLSKAERDELEKLKGDVMKRKADLKEQGLSGGQCNKDPEVMAWVTRMTELKIKEDPSLAADGGKQKKEIKKSKGALTESDAKELGRLEVDVEEYRQKLIKEFGYSKKDIAADPDFKEMSDRLAELRKRA